MDSTSADQPVTAAVVLVEAQHPEPSVLLIRRPLLTSDPWSGQWAFPGGRWQVTDRDLLITARRELHEEVGLQLAGDLSWTALPIAIAGLHRGAGIRVAPFHIQVKQLPTLIPDSREVAAYRWCSLDELGDRNRHQWGLVPGGGEQQWPHIVIDGTPLWGFTWRVLHAWMNQSGYGSR